MKLGLFGMPLHPATRNLADAYEADQNRVILADELGYSEAYIGEHQTCAAEPVASPLMLLAGVINRTKNIKLCSGVTTLPMYHPVTVASTVAQFDQMARGRFIWGIGPGGLASDLEAFDREDAKERTERMHETVEIVKGLWNNESPHRVKTEHYDFAVDKSINKDASVGDLIKPFQLPHPPIASTAMSPYSNSVKQAVLKGWFPMSANFTPLSTMYSHWTKIVEAYAELGEEPTGENWRVSRNVVVAETDEEARARMLDPEGPNYFYFDYFWKLFFAQGVGSILNGTGIPDDEVTLEQIIEDVVIFGSPETVARKLNEIRESAPFGTLLVAMLDAPTEKHEEHEQESMRLLATEVVPKLCSPQLSARV